MRPPSFVMEAPPDHHHQLPLPASTMSDRRHDAPVELNQLPPPKIAKPPSKLTPDSDETEYSTSFADTTSTNENDSSTLNDAEVESKYYSDTNDFSSPFDDFGSGFRLRKKKLTSHWRNFIRPIMWRCKWAELKIKQFESQALKYAKTIEAHDRMKQLASNQSIPEGFSSRSMPFTSQRRRKLMKRRKRVRVEDKTDAKLYMSQHCLFSYHESKKSDPDGISMTDDFDDPGLTEQNTSQEDLGLGRHNSGSFLEDKDNDMEHILRKIDIAQSRVHKLKAQSNLVISKNARKFSSSENLNHLVLEAQTSSVRSPTFSTCNGDAMSGGGLYTATQNISEFDMGDLEMPEHVVSSYGEGFHIPDIIESTAGLLSSADVTQHQPQAADSCENIVDNMVLHNQTAEAERDTFIKCQQQPVAKQEVEKSEEGEEEEEESIHPGPAMESDIVTKDAVTQEQSTLKPCLASEFQIPKNKRKRGERKAGTGNWSRQCPGEPDAQ